MGSRQQQRVAGRQGIAGGQRTAAGGCSVFRMCPLGLRGVAMARLHCTAIPCSLLAACGAQMVTGAVRDAVLSARCRRGVLGGGGRAESEEG